MVFHAIPVNLPACPALLLCYAKKFSCQNLRSYLATDRNLGDRRTGGCLVTESSEEVIVSFGEVIGSFGEVIVSFVEVIGSFVEVIGEIEGIEMTDPQEEEEEDSGGEDDPQEIGTG